jgi:uncharacterized protein
MKIRRSLPPLALLAALGLCVAPAARAKFISPPDVLKEPALTAIVDALKKAKSSEENKPSFDAAAKLATDAPSPERQFLLGYLYQYGLGTEASLEKSREAYQKAADAGYAPAKNNLGLLQLASGGDPTKAVALVEDLANAGDAAAQTSMGQLYMDGVPAARITKDADKARVWFERASAAGDSDATWALALLIGNQPNLNEAGAKQALDYMEQAVKANHLPALIEYGSRLVTGNLLKQDIPRGLDLLQQAADKGANQGLMTLGSLYENGTGVKKDEAKALTYYQQAIAKNEFSAYNKIGYFHENGVGTPKDEKKAAEQYQLGADKKVGMCMFNLAVFHDEGKGGLKKDPAAAFDWHYKAAMSAFVPSQLALATRYRDGKGTAPDAQAALAWYQRAMQNGDLTGALNVAAILENGSTGLVDNKTAAEIYKEAATKGNPLAMASLGAMIEDGRGVQGDFKQVFLLYTAGAEAKIEAAKERLANFKKRLNADQLKEAEAFVIANRGTPAAGVPAAAPEKKDAPAKPAPKPAAKPAPAKPAPAKDKR